MGTDVPLMGFRNMEAESQIWGMPEYSGAYWNFNESCFGDVSQRPTDYKNLPTEPKYGYAETEALDTAIDAAFDAIFSVSEISKPLSSPARKNPVNVSPAAVVSITSVLKIGCINSCVKSWSC